MKTPQEIQALKDNWSNDPCWDIEDTEGFEAHRDELLAFRQKYEADTQAILEARRIKHFIQLVPYHHPKDEVKGPKLAAMQARANAFMQSPDIIEIKSCQYHNDGPDIAPVISIVYTARQEIKLAL